MRQTHFSIDSVFWTGCFILLACVLPAASQVVSTASSNDGVIGNNRSFRPAISADGRFVAYESRSTNLLAEPDENPASDIFLHDRSTGTNILISRRSASDGGGAANGSSRAPSISADGRYVGFLSLATNLFPDGIPDGNGGEDAFVYDTLTGQLTWVSRQAPADGGAAANRKTEEIVLSPDGRWALFSTSATNLIPGGTPDLNNAAADIYLRDMATGNLELINRQGMSEGGAQANGGSARSINPSMSADRRFFAFASEATNLMPGGAVDANGPIADIYVLDRQTGDLEIVSLTSDGEQGDRASYGAGISDDGRWVLFQSASDNFLPSGVNFLQAQQVFIYDRELDELELISRRPISDGGEPGPTEAYHAKMTPDGRHVTFISQDGLVPGALGYQAYVMDRLQDQLSVASRLPSCQIITLSGFAAWPAITPDGRTIAFQTATPGVGPVFDTNVAEDILVADRAQCDSLISANAGPDQLLECTGALTQVDLVSSDSGSDLWDTYTWSGSFGTVVGPQTSVDLSVASHPIELTVSNSAGFSATDQTLVEIVDSQAPAITLAPTVTLVATNSNGVLYTPEIAIEDLCDPDPDISIEPELDLFPPGVTEITVTATDSSGNSATATQIVEVQIDDDPSEIECGGFFAPIAPPPMINTVNAKGRVFLKWECVGPELSRKSVRALDVTEISCEEPTTAIGPPRPATPAVKGGLWYFPSFKCFLFVWRAPQSRPKTDRCYEFTARVGDEETITAWFRVN